MSLENNTKLQVCIRLTQQYANGTQSSGRNGNMRNMPSRPQSDSQARIGTAMPVRVTTGTTTTTTTVSKGTGWFWADGWDEATKEALPPETTSKTASDSRLSYRSRLVEQAYALRPRIVKWTLVSTMVLTITGGAYGGVLACHRAYRGLQRLVRR